MNGKYLPTEEIPKKNGFFAGLAHFLLSPFYFSPTVGKKQLIHKPSATTIRAVRVQAGKASTKKTSVEYTNSILPFDRRGIHIVGTPKAR